MREELKKIKEKFEELVNKQEELERAKEYSEIRNQFAKEYSTENFRKLNLEEYTNVKTISTNNFGYKIEFGNYRKIGNPKVSGPNYKFIIYRSQENQKYVIGNINLEEDEAKEKWIKLREYIADFLDDLRDVKDCKDIKFSEKFNREKLNELLEKECFLDDRAFNSLFAQVPGTLLYIATQLYPDKFIGIKSHASLNKLMRVLNIKCDKDIKLNCIHKSFLINKYLRENIAELNNEKYDPIILFDALNETYHLFGYEDENDGNTEDEIIERVNTGEKSLNEDILDKNDGKNKKEYNFMTDTEFNKIIELLEFKKNIILEGVPGVGKTYIAKKIAKEITSNKEENIKIIQFHQSYAYEDFVQGLRPTDKNTFEPVDGILKVLCDEAKKHIDNKYVMIIDEINRGNISKIFGETFMLIEKDKRIKKEEIQENVNSKYAVTLPYSKNKEERFDIPENVYFIGTMNTMDRSIALMDFALRRRFAVYEVKPCFEDEESNNIFTEYLKDVDNSKLAILVEKIKSINNSKKLDKIKFGHSYFCGLNEDSNLDIKIDFIINHEILPQLKEYLLGDDDKNKKLQEFLNPDNTKSLEVDKFLNKNDGQNEDDEDE